jgi:hypothetical protein
MALCGKNTRLIVFISTMVLSRIFLAERDELTRGCGNFHSARLCTSYSSENVKMIPSKRIEWKPSGMYHLINNQ